MARRARPQPLDVAALPFGVAQGHFGRVPNKYSAVSLSSNRLPPVSLRRKNSRSPYFKRLFRERTRTPCLNPLYSLASRPPPHSGLSQNRSPRVGNKSKRRPILRNASHSLASAQKSQKHEKIKNHGYRATYWRSDSERCSVVNRPPRLDWFEGRALHQNRDPEPQGCVRTVEIGQGWMPRSPRRPSSGDGASAASLLCSSAVCVYRESHRGRGEPLDGLKTGPD